MKNSPATSIAILANAAPTTIDTCGYVMLWHNVSISHDESIRELTAREEIGFSIGVKYVYRDIFRRSLLVILPILIIITFADIYKKQET